MGLICSTTEPIGAINLNAGCKEDLSEIDKVFFQDVYSTGTTKNTIVDPTMLANLTPFLTAGDKTKLVQSPFLNGVTPEAGASVKFGGRGVTRGATRIVKGSEATTFTGMLYQERQNVIADLKKYIGRPNLGVWLIDEFGDIGCLADDVANPNTYYPIPIEAFFVGDKKLAGADDVGSNMIEWEMRSNWSDNFTIIRPVDYNALSILPTT